MDNFFANAPENYEVPKGEGRYMKFEAGANKFRILEKPIFGWEAWQPGQDGKDKPVRFRMNEKPNDLRSFRNQRLNHFWAMPVWNFKTKRVEILGVTQKTILSAIENLARNEDWGSPLGYSITVTKEGSTKEDTKYHIAPSPHQPIPPEVKNEWAVLQDEGFDLNAMYAGGDPFNPSQAPQNAPGAPEMPEYEEDMAQPE
jgi:hypothetical protein